MYSFGFSTFTQKSLCTIKQYLTILPRLYALCLAMAFALLVVLIPNSSHAQNDAPPRLSYQAEATPLKQALKTLKKQYNLRLAYGEQAVKNIEVTVSFTELTLFEAFSQLLAGTELTFVVVDARSVLISRQRDQNNSPGPSLITVQGVVRDATSGESLPYATLRSSSNTGSLTNAEGLFTLVNVADTATITVNFLGYQPQTLQLNRQAANQQLQVALAPAPRELEEVIVNAESIQLYQLDKSTANITMNPVNTRSLLQLGEADVLRAMQYLPGVQGTNDVSAQLSIRGSTPNQNLILFDGFTIYHADHFFGYLSAFNPNAIKSARLLKGGYEARYGGRAGGVIDITGKDGSTKAAGGSFDLNLLSVNATAELPLHKGRGSLFLAARHSYSELIETGLYTDLFSTIANLEQEQINAMPPPPNRPPPPGGGGGGGGQPPPPPQQQQPPQQATLQPDFLYNDYYAKLSYSLSLRDDLSLSLYKSDDVLTFFEQRRDLLGDTLEVNTQNTGRTEWGNIGGSIQWARQWNRRHNGTWLLSGSEYTSTFALTEIQENTQAEATTFEDTVTTDQFNRVEDFTVAYNHQWHVNNNEVLQLGAQYNRISNAFNHFLGNTLVTNNSANQASLLAAYAQYAWMPRPWLSVNTGFRAYYYDVTDKAYLEPRLNFVAQLTNQVHITGAYGRHNQFINQVSSDQTLENSRDFYILADDDILDVHRADHVSLGLGWEGKQYALNIEGYYSNFGGLLEYALRGSNRITTTDDFDRVFFSGTGKSRGIEVMLQKTKGRYRGWLAYTLSKVDYRHREIDNNNPYAADHDQRHELKLVNTYSLKQFEFYVSWIYGSGTPFSELEDAEYVRLRGSDEQVLKLDFAARNGLRLPNYHRMDVGVSWLFKLGNNEGRLSASIFNLYNRTNIIDRETVGLPTQNLPNNGPGQQNNNQPIIRFDDLSSLGVTPQFSFGIKF